jgi:hypothetical protein
MKNYISTKGRMKIHIVGAGPTGMSLAWEIIHSGEEHDITIYDKKTSAGGSWWEPSVETRDLHAHRVVFDKAFINTRSLFGEMGIDWDEIFEPSKDGGEHGAFLSRSLAAKDYIALLTLVFKVYTQPDKYRGLSLRDSLGELTEGGAKLLEHLPLIMDGVDWNVMSAFEFIKNLNHVALSKPYTQRVSGKVMSDAMEGALLDAGVNFVFDVELEKIEYGDDTYKAYFSNETEIDDGYLFLCVDNSPALKLLGDNWGTDADKKVRESTYGAINVLLDYEEPIKIKSDLEIATETAWNLQPKVLSDGKTVSCVICKITREVLSNTPEMLKLEVVDQLGLPTPENVRIGWGADWNEEDGWIFSQSSGVLSLHGQLPFFGNCPKVAMCGMMSPRTTPYSSIEAAIEVSRSLSHECFGTRKPMKPFTVNQLVLLVIMILIVLILLYRNRHQ